MPPTSDHYLPPRPWHARPTGAVLASLVTVAFFIALLGLVFLPSEVRKLIKPDVVSVTHHLPADGDQPAVSLYWHASVHEKNGSNYCVAVHDGSADRTSDRHSWAGLQPRCIARGASNDLFVGNDDGSVYWLKPQETTQPPIVIGRYAEYPPKEIVASQCGRWVVWFNWDQVWVWNTARQTLQWNRSGIACFALRPGTDTLICCTSAGELIERELETGHQLRSLGRQAGETRNLATSRDGKLLALLHAPTGVSVRNLQSESALWHAESGPGQRSGAPIVVFSPCGRLVVSIGQQGSCTLTVWDAHTGANRCVLAEHRRAVLGAGFGADGRLYSWGLDGTVRSWDAWHGVQLDVLTVTASPAGQFLPVSS